MSKGLEVQGVVYTSMRDLLGRFHPDVVFVYKPQVQFSKATKFWEKEKYSLVDIVEANGRYGGIWDLQNEQSSYGVTQVTKMAQCVTLKISKGNQHWICTGVYASPVPTLRRLLWDHLRLYR